MKNSFLFFIKIIIILSTVQQACAQNDSLNTQSFSPPVIIRCGTMMWDSIRRVNDPTLDKWEFASHETKPEKISEEQLLSIPPPINREPNNNSVFDARLLNYYSEVDLIDIQQNNPEKYSAIFKYYTSSYQIEQTECTSCVETNPKTFDVSVYEKFRQKTRRVIIVQEKYGFILTLFAIDEFDYTMPWFKNKR